MTLTGILDNHDNKTANVEVLDDAKYLDSYLHQGIIHMYRV